MATKGLLKQQHAGLHRFLSGVTIACFFVAVIGAVIAKATYTEILVRGVTVVVAGAVVSSLLIRFWAMWQRYE